MDAEPDATGTDATENQAAAPVSPDAENERLNRWVARTTRWLDLLALIFLFSLFVQWLLVDIAPHGGVVAFANTTSWLVWLAFAIDYVVRFTLSFDKRWFVGNHKVDLLMVLLPFLRILRVALILRKSIARISTEQIASSILLLAAGLMTLGALVVWRLERDAPDATITTVGRSFWWAVVTTTTVGYGDEYPVTPWGRVVAAGIMLVGIGLIGTVSATVASWFVARRASASDEEDDADDAAREAARAADVEDMRARLDSLAAEQTRIRELLERLAGEGRPTS